MLPTNNNNRSGVSETTARGTSAGPDAAAASRVLMTATLRLNGKAMTAGPGEPIRNDSEPICSDSIKLDSDLQPSRDRLPILLPHVRLIKDLRAPQGLDGREAEPWHRDSITISRRPFIRSNASARRPRLQ